jgi:hypothetical protein
MASLKSGKTQIARGLAGIVAGLVCWFLIATIGNLLFRVSWPGYAELEIVSGFTLVMLIARLLLGAASSVCAGTTVAWITRGNRTSAVGLGIVLTALFVPVHYNLWEKFPIWYHLLFLASLLPLTLLGAVLRGRPPASQ